MSAPIYYVWHDMEVMVAMRASTPHALPQSRGLCGWWSLGDRARRGHGYADLSQKIDNPNLRVVIQELKMCNSFQYLVCL